MLTPQEVSEKTFKQAFVGGYDMPAVDEFLEQLTEDFTNLFKENAVLKNKMKVLVEKLEEYRSNEDSIRQAYLAIRTQAEKELEDARAERERILGDANEKARKFTGDLEGLIAKEEKRLTVTREQTASFIEILKECYYRQIEQLDIIMTASMDDSPKKKHDDAVRDTVAEIDASVSAMRNHQGEAFAFDPSLVSADAFPPELEAPAPSLDVPPRMEPPVEEPAPEPVYETASNGMPVEVFSGPSGEAAGAGMPEAVMPTAEPPAAAEPDRKPISDEDLIYSIQQSLTATFNVNEEVDWTPDEISEVQRPTFDFSSLPGNFGHKNKPEKKKGKR